MRKYIPTLTLFLLLIVAIVACGFCINTIIKRNDTITQITAQLEQEKILPTKVDADNMTFNSEEFRRTSLMFDRLSGIDVFVNENKFTISTTDEAETYFYYNGDPITYESDVIDKEIVQVLVSGYGSACKVLFLMEDGTVRYIEGNDIIKRDFTLRNIDNLKDVVRLQKATFTRNNGGATILAVAVMSDGTSKVIE